MCQNISNMAKYPQTHLEIPLILIAILAIDIIGHLSIIIKGKRWSLTAICLYTLYVLAVPAENIIQACLSSILAHKRGS